MRNRAPRTDRSRQTPPLLLRRMPEAGQPQKAQPSGAHGIGRPMGQMAQGGPRRRNDENSADDRRRRGVQHRSGHVEHVRGGRGVHRRRRTGLRAGRWNRLHRPRPLLRLARIPRRLGQMPHRAGRGKDMDRDKPRRRRPAHLGTDAGTRRNQGAGHHERRSLQPRTLHHGHRTHVPRFAGQTGRPHVPFQPARQTRMALRREEAWPRTRPPTVCRPD